MKELWKWTKEGKYQWPARRTSRFVATAIVLMMSGMASAQDADTVIKVQQARLEAPACVKLVKASQALGSIQLGLMPYAELDKYAAALSHCAFVLLTTSDDKHCQ